MARIKSAWEIALEKTADLQVDEEKLQKDENLRQAMALAGSYLNNVEMSFEEIQKKYKAEYKEGLVNVIISNLFLPMDDSFSLRFDRTADLVNLLDQSGQGAQYMAQIKDFFSQYILAKKDFAQRMKEQLKQAMEQNPGQVNTQQYSELIEQNLKKIESQYQGALDNSKEALKQILG